MFRYALFVLLVGVTAGVTWLFWPRDREPILIDGETFFVEQAARQISVDSADTVFVFAMEHETGFYDSQKADAHFLGRIYCHVAAHPNTRDELLASDRAQILIYNYDWKVGRMGAWKGHGFTFDVSEISCGPVEG